LRRQTDADENDDEDIQGNRQKYQSFETLSHSLQRKVPLRVRFVIAFLRCLSLRSIYTRVRFRIRLVCVFKKQKSFCSYEWANLM
jgi:hypothetical protein